MKIKQVIRICFLCLIAMQVKAQSLTEPIDKGIIKGDFTIELMDTSIMIKPNEYFSLSKLGLVANRLRGWYADDIKKLGDKHWKEHVYYRIKITRPSDNTAYYGIMMFYNTNSKHKKDEVCQFYQIAIPDKLFNDAQQGHMSQQFEYWQTAGFGDPNGGPAQFTWVIWFSNTQEPFKK